MATEDQNIVGAPPLMTPITDPNGMLSKSWSIWFRDLYRRTAYKGGNAIDDNKNEIDEAIIDVGSTLEEVIEQVLINLQNITENNEAINDNSLNIEQNEENLSAHEQLTEAHDSNGDIVGFNDTADETINGLVKRMLLIADAIQTTAGVAIPDATAAPAAYSQAHSQELVDLANANKLAINTIVVDFNAAIGVINQIISNSKASGQMTT